MLGTTGGGVVTARVVSFTPGSDPIFILGYLFLGGLGFECKDAADANDDGETVITDTIYILSSLFAGGPSPPEPFPGESMDPTADTLGCRGH